MRVLSGDIGGTKTRIALIEVLPGRVRIQREETYVSKEFPSLQSIIARFLDTYGPTSDPSGFGVAGPVRNDRSETTNLPWSIDARQIEQALTLPEVHLLNDLEATAWGVTALGESDLHELHPGNPDPAGNISVIAAGTGLGEAAACRRGGALHPFATEGGHADFAPEEELEFALFQSLAQSYGHVSWERVVSGMGIAEILRFLVRYKGAEMPAWLEPEMQGNQAAGAISRAADEGRCQVCADTMSLFVRLYGRETGNHALKVMATGGVYLGGGIAPKILHRLKEPPFLEAFFRKGRMEPLMRNMPVRIILNDRAALYGAALAAASRSQGNVES